MLKKKNSFHFQHRWRWKLGFGFCACIVFLLLLKLEQGSVIWPTHTTTTNGRNLLKAAAAAPFQRKVAFLFLARNRLPLDIVWNSFFQEAEEELFSIYIHSRPRFVFDKRTTGCKFFHDRQLTNSIQVEWGEASMIEAERLLLREALKDSENERFLVLSDSCIPLYNFTFVYNYVMASPKSFVDSFRDTKEKRYNPRMAPSIEKSYWRKGSQWFVLIRNHAEVVAYDTVIFPLFQKHCKRRPSPEFWRQKHMGGDPSKMHNCIPDEHYVQTLLAIKGLENEIEKRTLTYTLWNQTGKNRERKGWHPVMFASSDVNAEMMSGIKAITSVYYETEYRTEWCSSNGTFQPCFLFARKFTRDAGLRLLNQTNWRE